MARHAPLPTPSRPLRRRLGRRTVLGSLGAVGLASAACDAATTPGSTPGAIVTTAPAEDADTALVESTGQRIADTAALVLAAGRARPELRGTARRLDALHAAHLDELGWSGTATPAAPPPAAAARAELVAAEAGLQEDLLAAAREARSGSLAQVLASMAAAVAQRRGQW